MNSWLVIALSTLLICLVSILLGIYALLKQKVVVDGDGNVVEIDLAFFGKMRTNVPSLAAVFLGIALAGFVVNKVRVTPDMTTLSASVNIQAGTDGSHLMIGAIPTDYLSVGTVDVGTDHLFEIDVIKGSRYNVVAMTVVGLDNSRPIYAVVQGPAPLNQTGQFEFEAKLGGSE